MEAYEKRLRNRVRVSGWLIALLLVVMVAVGELSGRILLDGRTMTESAQRCSSMLFFGALIWLIVRIVRTKRLLKMRLVRREREIAEADERRRMIRERSGGTAMNILLWLLAAAVFVLAYVDMTAFETARWILLGALALKGGCLYYYSRKF
ncbi:MAG: hypothetical protein IJO98_08665 [Clostridia bacterium]|nr:hypothetical protein [Clostridia bacterium]